MRLPDGLSAKCSETLASRRAPALLALVVLGRVTPNQIDGHVRRLSDALDALYDTAEADALESHDETRWLMRNELAEAQLREHHHRRAA